SEARIIRFNPYDYPENSFLGYETLVSYAFAQVLKTVLEQEGPPAVIESQEYNGIAYFTLLYKRLLYPAFRDLYVVVTIHAPSFACLPYNHVATYKLPYFWIGEMERFCLKAADRVISPSHYMVGEIRKRAEELDFSYDRVFNPFDSSRLPEPDPASAAASNEFIFYGKASPLKGIFELLSMFRKVWSDRPEIKLRILGGTDYYYHPEGQLMEDVLKARYGKYIASGQLILDGPVAPEALAGRIARARAILIPSRIDNLPYAVIECMALGKVIICSTSGGHTELIEDGRNGYLFSLEAEEEFLKKVGQVLALDEAGIGRIGEAARRTVKELCDPGMVLTQKEKLIFGQKVASRSSFPFLRQVEKPKDLPVQHEEKGLLSVVIPYYNMGAYVDDTVSSLLQCSYRPMEIIIVNDGSTEEASIEKLKSLGKNPAIRIIHKENGGLSLARNSGAMEAKGEFLAFLDPDDQVEAGYYTRSIEVLQHYDNVFFAGSWVRYFGAGKGIWPCFTPEPPFVLYHNMINTSALLYKKRFFLQYGLNDKQLLFGMEDYDSLLGMLERGCNGIAFPETFFHYRVRKDSMARQFTRSKVLYLYQLLAEKHKVFYCSFAAELSNLLNSNGQGFLIDNPTLDLQFSDGNKVIRKVLSSRGLQYIKRNKVLKRAAIKLRKLFKGI
ncbi:MAG: glycosyltransferase, partial [Bacteroidetes bacterium]|nr:glycosyltransferase [Bacteroidota bacterium]